MERSQRRFVAAGIDIDATVRALGLYGPDPTHRRAPGMFAKAVLTPCGPGTMRLTWGADGAVTAEAWGAGATWLLEGAPRWVGRDDDVGGFDPSLHPRVATWWRRHPGLRLASIGVVWQELLLVLLGQRVTAEEAIRSWVRMCRTWGEPAPGPCELVLPPRPDVLATLAYTDLHRVNVDRRRADAMLLAARRAGRLEEAATMPVADAITRLSALPGLGVWTATATALTSHGDPDTIVLGDYGLPAMVHYAFTGENRRLGATGDEVMCAHLAPWAGHRRRVVQLLSAAGVSPPRRAPRAFNPDIRRL